MEYIAFDAYKHYTLASVAQPDGRLMGQAAEHHMRHFCKLAFDCLPDMRLVVAMAGGPPARHAVDQFAAVCQHDARALRSHDR